MKILNRIVTFVLAAAIFPAMFTRVLIRFVVEPGGFLAGQNLFEETITTKELVEYFRDGTLSFGSFFSSSSTLPSVILDMKGWLIATVTFLVLAMLIAIVIMGCALFTRAHKTVLGLSAGGILSCFVAMACFSKFTTPFIEGTSTIADLMPTGGMFDGLAGQIAQALLPAVTGDVVVFQLGSAVVTTIILFFAVAMWTLAYYVTLPEEEKAAIKNPPVKQKKVKEKKEKASK